MQSENLFNVLTLRSEQFEIIIRVNQFADNLLQAGANLHQSNANFHQLLVSCGGGRRLADGLRKQHVRTIRLPVWDTLEDFFATSDCT